MNKVSRESVRQLLEYEDTTTLSIYLPTHRFPTSEHIAEDKIRFKNLVRAGEELLEKEGVDEAVIKQMIGSLEGDFYDDTEFWRHTTRGLAIFCSPAGARYFHLPVECDELVGAGDRYDITPLLASCSLDTSYYLLALAVHNPVLYKGDMYGIEHVEIELPKSPEEALGIDELHSNSQTVRAGGYGAGNPGAKSHGQGDSRQAGQEERLKFFRMIDEKLRTARDIDNAAPFLIAGTDDDISGYREVSKLQTVLEPTLSGNYTELPPHEIHEKAWPIVKRECGDKELADLFERINSLIGTGKVSVDADDIERAAKEGRVDTLVVGCLTQTRDTVVDSVDEVMKLVFSDEYHTEKAGVCGRLVHDHGGTLVGALRESMPSSTYLAALYRY